METSEFQKPVTVEVNSNMSPSPETHSEHVENEVLETQMTVSEAPQKKRRRKPQEDNTIDDEFASRLDMSCTEGTVAPSIVNAYILEFAR